MRSFFLFFYMALPYIWDPNQIRTSLHHWGIEYDFDKIIFGTLYFGGPQSHHSTLNSHDDGLEEDGQVLVQGAAQPVILRPGGRRRQPRLPALPLVLG